MKKISRQLIFKTEQLQNDCHKMVDNITKASKKNISHQDATNIWLFTKLAELELKIEKLTNKEEKK